MNRTFKTVFNKARGTMVAVNEITSSHAQARGSETSAESADKPRSLFKPALTAMASLVAMAFAMPTFAYTDVIIDEDQDTSGSTTVNWGNVTIEELATLTNDAEYYDPTFSVENAEVNAHGTLTIKAAGTLTGDGVFRAKQIVTETGATLTQGTVSLFEDDSAVTTLPTTATELFTNAGTTTIGTLSMGKGEMTNTGSVTVTNAFALTGKVTNDSTAKLLSLPATTVTGELANNAATNATVASMTMTGGKVTGTGSLTVTGEMSVDADSTVTQNELATAGAVTNAGTVTATTLNQTSADSSFTNSKTANFTNVTGTGTVTNAEGGTMGVTEKLSVLKTASNTGTLTANAIEVTGATATFSNSNSATAATATGTGSFTNTGTMEVTSQLTVKNSFNNQGSLTAKAITVEANGTLENSGKWLESDEIVVSGNWKNLNDFSTTQIKSLTVKNGGVVTGDPANQRGFVKSGASDSNLWGLNITVEKGGSYSQFYTSGVKKLNVSGDFHTKLFYIKAESEDQEVTITNDGRANIQSWYGGAIKQIGKITNYGTLNTKFRNNDTNKNYLENYGILSDDIESSLSFAAGFESVENHENAQIDLTKGTESARYLSVKKLTNKGIINAPTAQSWIGAKPEEGEDRSWTNTGTITLGAFYDQYSTINQQSGEFSVVKETESSVFKNIIVTGGTMTFNNQSVTVTGHFENSGTLNLSNTGVYDKTATNTNSGTLTGVGSNNIYNLTQTGNGTSQFETLGLHNSASIGGKSFAVSKNLTLSDGTYSSDIEVTVGENLNLDCSSCSENKLNFTGAIKVDGKTTVSTGAVLNSSKLTLNGETDISGTVNATGTGLIADLSMNAGAKLLNSGNLTVTKATKASEVTYEQSGTGVISFTDGKWFDTSTINLLGGTIARGTSGLGNANQYLVKAAAITQFPSDLSDASWKDGMSVLSTNTFDGTSSVQMQLGGLFDVTKIDLSAETVNGKVLTLDGGAVQTTLDQFFDGVATDAISMEAIDSTGRITISGSAVGLTTVGDFKSGISDHMTLTSGDIVFTDAMVSTDLVSSVQQRISSLAGNSDVAVHYTGDFDKVFTTTVANNVIASNSGVKAIFDTSTLYSRTDDNAEGKNLVIGTSTTDADAVLVNDSIGFANVAQTSKVTVQDGKEFALIGRSESNYDSLVGDDGGSVTATGDGSKFTLGTLAKTALKGKVAEAIAADGGTVYAKGGDYQVTDLKANAGGKVEVGVSGKLTATNLTMAGEGANLVNAGNLSVTNFTDDTNAVSSNAGALTLTKESTVNGTFTNETTGNLKVEGVLTVGGKLTNKATGDAVMTVEGLEVAAAEALVNEGNLTNSGDTAVTGAQSGALRDGKYAFHNKAGAVADLTAGKTTVGTVAAAANDLGDSRAAAGESVLYNEGTAKFGALKLGKNGVLVNKTNGDNTAVIEAESIHMDALATFNNNGNVVTDDFDAAGIVRNVGKITAKTVTTSDMTNNGALEVALFTVNSRDDAEAAIATLALDDETETTTAYNYTNATGSELTVTNELSVGEGAAVSNAENATVKGSGKIRLASRARLANAGKVSVQTITDEEDSETINDGDIYTEDYTVNGSVQNNGTVAFKKNAVVNGSLVNGANGVITVGTSSGSSVEDGTGTMTVNEGGAFTNHGSATALTAISNAGTVTQNGGTVSTKTYSQAKGMTSITAGNFTTDKLEMSGGSFVLSNATETATIAQIGSLSISGGDFVISGGLTSVASASILSGGHLQISATDTTKVTNVNLTLADGGIKGKISVENAVLSIENAGSSGINTANDTGDTSVTVPTANATLYAAHIPLTIAATGRLAVGSNAADQVNNFVTEGSAWFGADSLFRVSLLDATEWESSAALVSEGTGNSLTVVDGAKLYVDGVGKGNYILATGFDDASTAELWANNFTYSTTDGGKATVSVDENNDVILSIEKVIPSVGPGGIVDEATSETDKNKSAVTKFITKAVSYDGDQAELINSVMELEGQAGVYTQSMALVRNVADTTEKHLSFTDSQFRNGQLQTWDGIAFWADALGQRIDVEGMKRSGGSTSYDGTNYGFTFGADVVSKEGLRAGASFSYQKGDMETKNAVATAKNKADAYSVTGYVAKNIGNVNIIGTAGYTHVNSDVSQSLSAVGMANHTLHSSKDILSLGVKGEYRHEMKGGVAFVPYAGARLVNVLSADATSHIAGEKAFRYDTDSVTQVQIPVGVAVEARQETESGWASRAVLDLSVTPVVGDRSADTRLSAHGLSSVDSISTDFADRVTGTAKIGFSAEKKGFSVGADAGFSIGNKEKSAVTFGVKARYRF